MGFTWGKAHKAAGSLLGCCDIAGTVQVALGGSCWRLSPRVRMDEGEIFQKARKPLPLATGLFQPPIKNGEVRFTGPKWPSAIGKEEGELREEPALASANSRDPT